MWGKSFGTNQKISIYILGFLLIFSIAATFAFDEDLSDRNDGIDEEVDEDYGEYMGYDVPESVNKAETQKDCILNTNKDLSPLHPLLLNPETLAPIVPTKYGIVIKKGESVHIACQGDNNYIKVGKKTQEKIIQCVDDKIFKIPQENRSFRFHKIACVDYPASVARETGRQCAGDATEIELGFNISSTFVPVIATCFDKDRRDAIYSTFNLTSMIYRQQTRIKRPDGFLQDAFYPDFNISVLYMKQFNAFKTLLGSTELAQKYYKGVDKDHYLARGHLSAKADFLYAAQQRGTFYYVNTAPQWQVFNDGNWKLLEINVRSFATERKLDLIVHTGVWGTATLPDKDNNPQKLYLYYENGARQVTVPEIFWKVVYEPSTEAGIAFVGHNDPYDLDVANKTICEDVCEKVKWLTWEPMNITMGYSYCCKVDDLRKTVTYIPSFTTTKLLV